MNTSVLSASRRRAECDGRHGFALVIVLVILSLMAIITVGYLSSMASERATAGAFGNRVRAEQMAQAGVDAAEGILRDYFKAFPDSATAWDTAQAINPDGSSSAGTTLYLRAVPQQNDSTKPNPLPGDPTDPNFTNANYIGGNNPSNVTSAKADNRQLFVLPLVSNATINLAANKASILPTLTADNGTTGGNSVNLNSRRQITDTQGWLGTPPGYVNPNNPALPKPTSVPWVYVTQQDNPMNSASAPQQIGRYAFWVEDESFRANVSYGGLGSSASHARRDNTANPLPPALPINPTDLDLVGVLNCLTSLTPAVAGANPTPNAQGVFDTRQSYPGGIFPESRAFAHTGESGSDASLSQATIDALRYLTTSQSAALNLSRHGTQRLNLNDVVPQPSPSATPSTTAVQKQIDTIVQTIRFHAPDFSQRFYRTQNPQTTAPPPPPIYLNSLTVPTDNATTQYYSTYLYKVAANIVDYIDPDPAPTIINAKGYIRADGTADPGGTVRAPGKQKLAFYGLSGTDGYNEIWAQGKDSAPCIEECATRFRGQPTADHSRYTLMIDYYVEVWNSSNLDVKATDLGPNPVLRIANPTKWVAANSTGLTLDLPCDDPAPASASPSGTRNVKPPQRDFDIDISGITFKAGVATVITTDPNYTDFIKSGTENYNHVFVCPFVSPGKRVYNGPMPTNGASPPVYLTTLRMVFGGDGGSGSTGGSDYETEIILTTDNGAIDSMYGGLPIYNGGSNFDLTNPGATTISNSLYGGSLHGNTSGSSYPAVTGDPRSNNEQIYYTLYESGSLPDQTRYFNETSGVDALGGFTLGLPNTNYVQPSIGGSANAWPDYYIFPSNNVMTNLNAPYVIANSALTSIGQLGDVYDPARVAIQASGANYIINARGGGRTFKIGQHDDRWDGDVASPSRTWASWRLADFFGVSDAVDQPGLININGVARDNGAALRAALTGFTFQPTAPTTQSGLPTQPVGKTLGVDVNTSSTGLQAVIDQITARVATVPPSGYSTTYSNPQPTYSNPPTLKPFVGMSTDFTGVGPFFERGELSEIPAFGRNVITPASTAATSLISGVNLGTAFDREREELFRRLVEMITTRGDVFTVYAMGQSLVPAAASDTTPRKVLGTQQLKVTFKLRPKNGDGTDFHPATDGNGNLISFDPNSTSNASGGLYYRFSKPDHYDVQVLSASSGNS